MSAIIAKAVDKLLDTYPPIEEVSPDFCGDNGEGDQGASLSLPHVHQWRIAEPEGAESLGICWTCREYKMFKNWDSAHDYVSTLEQRIVYANSGD